MGLRAGFIQQEIGKTAVLLLCLQQYCLLAVSSLRYSRTDRQYDDLPGGNTSSPKAA